MRAVAAHRGKLTPAPGQRGDVKYLVIAQRQDGRARLFQAYGSKQEAQAVARLLRGVGCPATVEVE